MCGIGGIVRSKEQKKINQEGLNDLISSIQHRGPDGSGVWLNKDQSVGLAHRRLAIIDLSEKGKQPMIKPEWDLSITYNGEIYNYVELKSRLEKKGYQFTTQTDTEVILASYKEFGYGCLNHFDGMFAFAIWDNNKKQLFCARDRFGEKPFHFYKDEQQFVFASEIKQFWSYGLKRVLSDEKMNNFISEQEIINDLKSDLTFYKNIFSLQAAHYLIIDEQLSIAKKQYWALNTELNTSISFTEACAKMNELLSRSIERRLRSDVAIGSSLSGGLDSSAIVYSINKQFLKAEQKQFTFSARFRSYEKDEGEFIDELIKHLHNVNRNDVFLEEEEFEHDITEIIRIQDEPFQSASIFAQYKVMQLAKKMGVTVLLDGQGADELLGGYETLYIDYLKQLFHNSPNLYPQEVRSYNTLHGKKYGEIDLERSDTVGLKLKRRIKTVIGKQQAVPSDYFNQTLKRYICGAQLQQLLRYADRNAMAHSVETRLPYLNHDLVEFVFTLPDSFKCKDGWPKYILRKTFENKLPSKIVWRKDKVGFETPEEKFLSRGIAQSKIKLAQDYVMDKKFQITPAANQNWIMFMTGSFISQS